MKNDDDEFWIIFLIYLFILAGIIHLLLGHYINQINKVKKCVKKKVKEFVEVVIKKSKFTFVIGMYGFVKIVARILKNTWRNLNERGRAREYNRREKTTRKSTTSSKKAQLRRRKLPSTTLHQRQRKTHRQKILKTPTNQKEKPARRQFTQSVEISN